MAFNECMGTELYRSCGLSCPEWAPVWLSQEFIDRNCECGILTSEGWRKPEAGWCFGSRFLGLQEAPLREILSGCDFSRIRNRKDFWKARLLDVLCNHVDNRQALFLEEDSGSLEAYFIDHGHLFGGPRGEATPAKNTSLYLDKRIYPATTRTQWRAIAQPIRNLDRDRFLRLAQGLPEAWVTPSALAQLNLCFDRLSSAGVRRSLADSLLEGMGHTAVELGRKPPRKAAATSALVCDRLPVAGLVGSSDTWQLRAMNREA